MTRTQTQYLLFFVILGLLILKAPLIFAEEPVVRLDLEQTIEAALKANLEFQRSKEEVNAAKANKNARMTEFFPTLNARYVYIRRDQPTTQALGTGQGQVDVLINPEDEYNFVTSFSQPIFTGFALINQYKIASLGLDAAEYIEKLTRQDVILDAKNAYYSILKGMWLTMT
jgi:outer membrane protein TolC